MKTLAVETGIDRYSVLLTKNQVEKLITERVRDRFHQVRKEIWKCESKLNEVTMQHKKLLEILKQIRGENSR